MSAIHFNERAGPLRVVFAHANGFNAQAYAAIFSALKVHAVAMDLRGHGFTRLPTDAENLSSYKIFAKDIAEFIERYTAEKIILSGHSCGAGSGIIASEYVSDRLAAYVGFDPVTLSVFARNLGRFKLGRQLIKRNLSVARNAGIRRRIFASKQAAFTRYKGRGVFKQMEDNVLRDYLEGGLRASTDGVELCCDPLWEQAIYCAQAENIIKATTHLPKNSQLHYAGKYAVSTSRTRAAIAKVIGAEKVVFHAHLNHMFPLYQPAYIVEILTECIERSDF